jgi:hypothetical protein
MSSEETAQHPFSQGSRHFSIGEKKTHDQSSSAQFHGSSAATGSM